MTSSELAPYKGIPSSGLRRHIIVMSTKDRSRKRRRDPSQNYLLPASDEDTRIVDKRASYDVPTTTPQSRLRLRLDLNLDVDIQIKARVHGDVTLSLNT
ncbi:hypothetical protein L208DRAFT_312353 [Tricholoma matsutake]|nr:hypothetical protein L208DRAFT_312353 [Tricholoma matsutake 945]